MINETHDPKLMSWVKAANEPGTDFPIQNLPFGVFARRGEDHHRVGVAIGDQVLDIGACLDAGLFTGAAATAAATCRSGLLNGLMAMGPEHWSALRQELSILLRAGAPHQAVAVRALVPISEAIMRLPARIGDYTDFYASVYHATNVGSMFRPDNPLLPNYKYVPIGYHGRSSSIVVSGTPIRRPLGQTKDDDAASPAFGPTRLLDYELELGVFVGKGNAMGAPINIADVRRHLFGVCIVNDWSARDIQKWEYQPLGPFLAKNFATTISPWVVSMEALEPFRIPAFARPAGDPAPLPYLSSDDDLKTGGLDITLEVCLLTGKMREHKMQPVMISRGSFRDMYWTLAQMVTHHASNGCNLAPGDLIASGTVSGKENSSRGCLLELTWRGKEPLSLPSGEERRFLQDGDEVIMQGYCEKRGFVRIGLGECRGAVVPASA
jgi:fumarylacetoacetase